MGDHLDAKARVKRVVKGALLIAGRLYRLSGTRILTYHSVGYRRHDMNVTPEDFCVQMRWLAQNHHVIPLTEAAEGAEGIAITFDDGYQDNLAHAAPILRELNLPATFFVVPERTGGMLDHDSDPETSRLMSWYELAELNALGFSIGAHTLTHRRLSTLTEEEQREEIIESADILESRLGCSIETFAYPFGSAADYDDTSVAIAKKRFVCAVTNRYGVNTAGSNPFTLRRIWIDSTDSLTTFRAKVNGQLDTLCLLDSPYGLRARRGLNRLLRIQ